MKELTLTLLISLLFIGCSAKEFNAGVDSVTTDITNVFEKSKDNSSN
ncbi:MAG: hypothetical protein JXQ67_06415 [Campylobacterales bacterium]|nr:hypothetical protein [Campylobacterales bacterium]